MKALDRLKKAVEERAELRAQNEPRDRISVDLVAEAVLELGDALGNAPTLDPLDMMLAAMRPDLIAKERDEALLEENSELIQANRRLRSVLGDCVGLGERLAKVVEEQRTLRNLKLADELAQIATILFGAATELEE